MSSPYINRFLQPDTIVPDYANPQSWNRYSYVTNNPLRYTDPTGHMQQVDDGGGRCFPGDQDCPLMADRKGKRRSKIEDVLSLVKLPTIAVDTSELNGPTIVNNALNGNLYAIRDLIVPTHLGLRLQGEFSASVGPWSPAATIGVNFVHNFRANQSDKNVDFTLEPYAGGVGWGGSVTGGALVGWGSSNIKHVISGQSEVIGSTFAGGPAISVSVVGPTNDTGDRLHVDPIYGVIPITLYVGGGAGAGYAGASAGRSMTIIP